MAGVVLGTKNPSTLPQSAFQRTGFLWHLIILRNSHERKASVTGLMEFAWDLFRTLLKVGIRFLPPPGREAALFHLCGKGLLCTELICL